jgi:predicted O-linked N-acetylglucosamine transferase (SPINDLY family)
MQTPLPQVFANAFALEAQGKRAEARALYGRILSEIPGHPGALLRIARQDREDGNLVAAREGLERAMASARAMGLPPADIWLELATLHATGRDVGAACRAYGEALTAAPGSLPALAGLERLARTLLDLRRFEDAEACARVGVERAAGAPQAWHIAATVAFGRGRLREAEAACRRGLEPAPGFAPLLHLLGLVLKTAGALPAARDALLAAVAAKPDDPDAQLTLGAVYLDLGLADNALRHLRLAIDRGSRGAEAYDNLGIAYLALGMLEPAIEAFERAMTLNPRLTPALANAVMALRTACAWERVGHAERLLARELDDPEGDPRCSPIVTLHAFDSPAYQAHAIRRWSDRVLPGVAAPAPIRGRGTQLRVGYVSANFREHPTAYLNAGMFELHARGRCEVFAYNNSADDGSAIRRRLRRAFANWCDVGAMGDAEAAARIRADGLDVLVDLNGHTQGGRLGIFALRPAPVQIHYKGFPGTIGYAAIDAIVADAIVVPPGNDAHYCERVVRLPRCYFVNDRTRALPPRPERAAVGLPDEALVLVCFNHAQKLSRQFFACWMETLRELPSAVLWLLAPDEITQGNLRAEAHGLGVAPERLVFAGRAQQDDHIARLRAADLAVDVLPYGSHTTGSDALWAGVPLLTCRGATFAGRVGASLLHAVGLPGLIAESFDEYRHLLRALAADRDRLRDLRAHLDAERMRVELFDTEGFTQDWERMLESVAPGR